MPKSSHTHSPPHSSSPRPSNGAQKMAAQDDKVDKVTEVALRKKKNADAQAAFRARRANYIATLEETGPLCLFLRANHIHSCRLYVSL